jgi:hypothetical protein
MSLILLPPPVRRRPPWGTASSIAVHLTLGLLAISLSTVPPLDQAIVPPPSISVELVPPPAPPVPAPQLSALAPAKTTAPAVPSASAAAPPKPSGGVPSKPDRMTSATKFFATNFLKDPANAKLKKTFSSFADSEKLVQLCNMEGLEQIRLADPKKYDPDVLVSYAMSDFSVERLTLIADGGAFHSGRSWTAIRLRCTIAPDYSGVTAFEFAIGEPIPKSEWAPHGLPEQYDDSD